MRHTFGFMVEDRDGAPYPEDINNCEGRVLEPSHAMGDSEKEGTYTLCLYWNIVFF